MDLSVACGPPLSAEPGLEVLTLPGFLREVTAAYAEREALVLGATRWTYDDLWERAVEVARALRAWGVAKDGRVGVLMTNRPEWVAAVFCVSLAGGVAVALSTFSTPDELGHLLAVSGVSVLLFERTVPKKDFAAILTGLEPRISKGRQPAAIGQVPIPAPPGHDRRADTGHRHLGHLPGPRAGRAARTGRGDGRGGAAERPGRAVLLVRHRQHVRGGAGGPRPLLDG